MNRRRTVRTSPAASQLEIIWGNQTGGGRGVDDGFRLRGVMIFSDVSVVASVH